MLTPKAVSILSMVLSSGLFIFLITQVFNAIIKYQDSILSVPRNKNKLLTYLILSIAIIAAFLAVMMVPEIVDVFKWTKGNVLLIVQLIPIAFLPILLILFCVVLIHSLYKRSNGIPASDSPHPTFTIHPIESDSLRVWIVKELRTGDLQCVSSRENFDNEKYIYVPKAAIAYQTITYSVIE